MKAYIRLLLLTKPQWVRVYKYGLYATLNIIFGLINFTLLIPLLNILFGTLGNIKSAPANVPNFSFNLDYFKDLFNYYFQYVVSEYGKYEALVFVCIIVVLSVMFTNIFRYLASVEIEYYKQSIVKNIRNILYDKVLQLDTRFFNNERKGDLLTKFTNNINEIEGGVIATLAVFLKEPVSLITFFIVLVSISFKLTLFTLIVIPISGIIISSFTKKLKKYAREGSFSFGNILSILDETIVGNRIIKTFHSEGYMKQKFEKENDKFTHQMLKLNLKSELAGPISEFSGVLVVSFILLYGGYLVLHNQSELSASEFVTYIIIFSQVLRPAKAISSAVTGLQKGLAAAERLLELADEPIHIKNTQNPILIQTFERDIIFENVSFAYHTDKVLQNINFVLPKGKMIALAGPSGSGKSTISDLIPRLYDIQEGNIWIDGIDLQKVDIYALRQLIGVVSQDPILFHDNIYNNILFGNPSATSEDVMQAARIANAHDFITQTENGYQTIIGERGVKLSGGQRQRISIARAVLKNPPILILDEATSALDTESEKLVQDALDKLMKNRTSLVIAHRLSTIQKADNIIILKDGKIEESGTHDELINLENGLYKRLNLLQNI
ncbi:MAG: ABC transporter ATP-binding protein [Cytophagales bacterium]|nr:ABC transporter ATP-binding protein [Cytophagales bacterium]